MGGDMMAAAAVSVADEEDVVDDGDEDGAPPLPLVAPVLVVQRLPVLVLLLT